MTRPGFDPTRPDVARVFEVLLGGRDNFTADPESLRVRTV